MIKMAELIKNTTVGNVTVDTFEIEDNNLAAIMQGIPCGKYARLKVNNEVVMSDTPMERRTNWEVMNRAFGDVLIGGLGIGMILMEIQDRAEVDSILVIEKSQDVIDAVLPQLQVNTKVKVICSDVFDYKPKQKFDYIYLDIWNWTNSDIYQNEMKPLIAKYRRHLKPKSENPDRKVFCWAQEIARKDGRLF